jgi:hypothetical protein
MRRPVETLGWTRSTKNSGSAIVADTSFATGNRIKTYRNALPVILQNEKTTNFITDKMTARIERMNADSRNRKVRKGMLCVFCIKNCLQ